ncbi:hypothetical protein DDE18_21405 [Nocardioides gansuensis]|uniref:DNA-binding protein n=1 Tax=Nocardioides gansuensis TaxID=2138300 RepID=A0A2T8F559_9ACTN|nr:zinc ribbon domain-containing protein [Nocardioides gansuensis]PVG80810.1 hypothetical protein DDE18_21405 [Nocardioides gansuensis]
MNESVRPGTGWSPAEVPPADEVTAAFWQATGEHRLTVQRCSACASVQHPPRAVCTGCSSMEHLAQVDATGEATVDVATTVHRAPRPDVVVPYTVARVRLAEGPLVLTRLEPPDPEGSGYAAGTRVVVHFHVLSDGRALPYFRPAPTEEY